MNDHWRPRVFGGLIRLSVRVVATLVSLTCLIAEAWRAATLPAPGRAARSGQSRFRDTTTSRYSATGCRRSKRHTGWRRPDAEERLYHQGVAELQREQLARYAGRRSTSVTVENLLHVPIDHFAEVILLGFYVIVSAIGLIQVCLNAPVNDPYSGAELPGRAADHQRRSSAGVRPPAARPAQWIWTGPTAGRHSSQGSSQVARGARPPAWVLAVARVRML